MNVYDFRVKNTDGTETLLKKYEGSVLLIINSATECGFTPQYEQLQKLYEKYRQQGLEILDFPCNQFGNQAPGTDEDIHDFCIGRFGISFPIFSKVDVNGNAAAPLFSYLKKQRGFQGIDDNNPHAALMKEIFIKMDPNYASSSDIKWNFTKFLVDREGNVVERFEPTNNIEFIEERIRKLL